MVLTVKFCLTLLDFSSVKSMASLLHLSPTSPCSTKTGAPQAPAQRPAPRAETHARQAKALRIWDFLSEQMSRRLRPSQDGAALNAEGA